MVVQWTVPSGLQEIVTSTTERLQPSQGAEVGVLVGSTGVFVAVLVGVLVGVRVFVAVAVGILVGVGVTSVQVFNNTEMLPLG
jgi:hypothetical protein